MKDKKPELSIIIPIYNRVQYINDAIKSIMDLEGNENIELLIITNIELSMEVSGCNARIINTDIRSLSGKLELGLDFASSDIVAFLEDDDLWCNDKIKKLIQVFGENEEIDYYHNGNVLFRNDIFINKEAVRKKDALVVYRNQLKEKDAHKTIKTLITDNIGFNLSSMAVRKSLLIDHTDVLKLLKVYGIDTLISIIALTYGKGIYVDREVRTWVRVHKNNSYTALISDTKDFDDLIILKKSINCDLKSICNYVELFFIQTYVIFYSRNEQIKRFKLFLLFLRYVKYRLKFRLLPEDYIFVTVFSRLISLRSYLFLLKIYHS